MQPHGTLTCTIDRSVKAPANLAPQESLVFSSAREHNTHRHYDQRA